MAEDRTLQKTAGASNGLSSEQLVSRRRRRRCNTLYFVLGMITAVLLIVLFFSTPLRNYLPGYLDVNKRAKLLESAMRIDSLEHENNLREAYLENMISIILDRVEPDSIRRFDSVISSIQDTLIASSEQEKAFVSRYAEQERFGLTALDAKTEGFQGISFYTPVKGELQPLSGEVGVKVVLARENPILAPQEGTVVSVDYLIGKGFQMVLQHGSDYLCVFSNLSAVMVDEGQPLKAGQVVGHASDWVGIKLWHRGKAVDPIALMSLE